MLPNLPPEAALRLMQDRDGELIDVREPDEHARSRILGARNVPLSRIAASDLGRAATGPVLFHCRSGARTAAHAAVLEQACVGREAYIVEGGLNAWRKAGLSVVADRRAPLEIMRQVQIVAGSLVLLGTILGSLISPWFHALSALVGAGLVFAGVSGFCGMGSLLRRMPWNRV